ncbi:MAG: FAD-binding protein [Xanthobacteraceae bacterium]|nr:MAG: FAD-binding protein [Xanthobacteraceae bacterium]
MALSRTIVVAGAGIGGLTAALALAGKGFRVIILEKAARLEEVGAGLQLSPNATRILIDLGLEPVLAPHVVVPDTITVMSERTGRAVVDIPIGRTAAFRYGSPYWVIHRGDLQAGLLRKALDHPDIELRLDVRCEGAASHARGVTVAYRKGMTHGEEPALLLVGADGVWSSIRHHLFPHIHPQFSGRVAWRGTIDPERLPRDFSRTRVQLWMGPNAHLVVYPISGGRRINIVAIVAGTWNRPGWSEHGDASEIKTQFGFPTWPIAARMLIGAVDEWKRWALFGLRDGGVWNSGSVAFLGDAAHAMLPFLAQGAGMAIEDAAVLARCLGQESGNVPVALETYAAQRRGRVARVQRTARQNGQIYHLTGPMALARNIAMRALGGARLLARNDWVYDWRLG